MTTRRPVLVVAVLLCLLSLPFESAAQQAQTEYRIGWLAPGPASPGGAYYQFLQRAKELGYAEGKNFAIDYRELQSVDDGKTVADELVRLKVDLIVAQAPTALLAARRATKSIPIVTFFIGDPIRMGVTESLARPRGNVTGFTWDAGSDGTGKALQVIKEMIPHASQISLLWNLDNDSHPFYVSEFEKYARTLGLSILSVGVRRSEELEGAFKRMIETRTSAVIIFSDPFTVRNREVITTLLARFPLAAMWGTAVWPLQGAVITFGANVADQPRRAAEYMDRILKGSAPADLPFQQPTRFDLILNVKVARSLGLTLPQSLLLRADQIIEQ
jgi:putative tryptophan/tyrosine transport system substrate-binding protein